MTKKRGLNRHLGLTSMKNMGESSGTVAGSHLGHNLYPDKRQSAVSDEPFVPSGRAYLSQNSEPFMSYPYRLYVTE
jgi:hypothetical protein